MDIIDNWQDIKQLFKRSFRSSFHFAVASVTEQGEPHVTPIGSMILGEPGKAIYFEKYPSKLPANLRTNRQVCVLAVNSSKWFWLWSLLAGRFATPPALRLRGEMGELRPATAAEYGLWQKRVKSTRFTRGYASMWKDMSMVRDIRFTSAESVNLGEMTASSDG